MAAMMATNAAVIASPIKRPSRTFLASLMTDPLKECAFPGENSLAEESDAAGVVVCPLPSPSSWERSEVDSLRRARSQNAVMLQYA